MRLFHKIIGSFFGIFFLLIFTGNINFFDKFNFAQDLSISSDSWISSRSRFGFVYIYILAFISVFFLVCSTITTRIWHSKFESEQELFLTEGVWIFFGYLILLATLGILYCFE